jgi:predicted HTH transcriptional regulator
MMFGTGLAVRERFANFRMDYINMCNLIGEERYSDRLTYDGRWENNLFQFFSIVLPKISFDLPRPFRMVGMQRDDDTPQHKAVREAFTNSIIHCDLMMESGVLRIEKHDDKLVFRNPGLLRLPIKQIFEGGVSYARNPKIQNMLRMVGYGENLGSGFPTIISAWKDAKWGEPELKNKFEIDEVELVLPIPAREGNDRVNDKINDRINDRIMATYTIIRLNPGIKRKDISNISGKSLPTIDRHIDVLTEDGLIEYRGSRKTGGYYVK